MGLRDTIPLQRKLVKVSDADGFSVRGASIDDVLGLFYRHRGEMTALFEQYAGRGTEVTADDVALAGRAIFERAPALAAEIIVVAADGDMGEIEAEVAHVRRFPAAVQIDALEKIASLTFTSEMPPGKLLAVALQAVSSAAAAVPTLPQP